jgi:hypothetical protein
VKRADGWVVQGLGTAGFLVLTGLGLWCVGWALAHAIDGIRAWIGAWS